ncbi:MAG: alcohol dehydrogenase catalytic domain-containing protein [Gemmatimonadetes bacterium]|nr:alcohol dehydrogenase catalytic domain-containing protein [Gemmatimonadota bacterium]MYH20404.1 alcohol dehydrogenase catalytic domain-containing protein [Gemmatimonadota bacterium]MYK98641.1 alcohol dehydrogenase catalytic domain-containing protein [Gemmatimonadota bacterium]
MRALMYLGTRQMEMQEVEEPGVTPGHAVLKVGAASICGSDLHGFLGKSAKRVPPLIMGHEFTGEVVDLGRGADGLAIGDRVTINPILSCGRCDECLRGRTSICPHRTVIGIEHPGAFANYVSVPAASCFRLPDHVGDLEGSMVESLSNALHIFDRSLHGFIRSVAVIGAGTQGLLALQVARHIGATRIAVTDMVPSRLALAASMGATHAIDVRADDPVEAVLDMTDGHGVDLAVEAVGHTATQEQAVRMLRQGGEAVLLGLGAETPMAIDGVSMVNRELVVRGSYAYTSVDFAYSLELISTGRIDVASMVVERDLEQGPGIFAKLVDDPGDLIKVSLVPGS